MRRENAVYKGKSEAGTPLLVRCPTIRDVGVMRRYINTLSRERTFIIRQGELVSYLEEKKYVEEQIKQIKKGRAVLLLAFSGGKLIGCSGVKLHKGAVSHEATFDVSIAKEFRGQGIGTLLMKLTLGEAKRLRGIKIITLGVFSNNPRAMALYEKFGFKKYGSLPKGIFHRGRYFDHHLMYRKI